MKHILLLIFALFTLVACSNDTSAPALNFIDVDGKEHALINGQSKATLVVFWATDCPGCIQEMPELVELDHRYADNGLTIIGVAMSHDTPSQIQAMRTKKALPYTLTWDKNGEIAAAFNNVRLTPTHFLITPDGEIVMRKIGALNISLLTEKLHSMGINPA
jgi:peroxiredoxin